MLKEVIACDCGCEEIIEDDSKQAVTAHLENGRLSGTYDFLTVKHLADWSAERWEKRPGRKPNRRRGRPAKAQANGQAPKKRGRPKGSKNKTKVAAVV